MDSKWMPMLTASFTDDEQCWIGSTGVQGSPLRTRTRSGAQAGQHGQVIVVGVGPVAGGDREIPSSANNLISLR
jgi:hypothetical protein